MLKIKWVCSKVTARIPTQTLFPVYQFSLTSVSLVDVIMNQACFYSSSPSTSLRLSSLGTMDPFAFFAAGAGPLALAVGSASSSPLSPSASTSSSSSSSPSAAASSSSSSGSSSAFTTLGAAGLTESVLRFF